MKLAIVLQGTSGSGKSTSARVLARKQKAILLEHDSFIFGTQPHQPEGFEHFDVGNEMMWECFKIALRTERPIIIEGVLTSFDKTINKFELKMYLDELVKNNYNVIRVVLQSSYENAARRMDNRINPDGHMTAVPKDVYDKLAGALEQSITADVNRIDTTELSVTEVVQKIEYLLPNV